MVLKAERSSSANYTTKIIHRHHHHHHHHHHHNRHHHHHAKIKTDSDGNFPLEETWNLYNVTILIKLGFNKHQNHYNYNIILEVCSY